MEHDDISKELDSETQKALDSAAEGLQGIADSSQVIGTASDKFALVAAGFCEGFELHRRVSSNDHGPDLETLEAMRAALSATFDEQGPEVALARKRLQERVEAVCNSFMQSFYRSVAVQFGDQCRVCVEKDAMTDDEANEFGTVVYGSRPADFYAFLYANDDSKIVCRCPSHFVEAFTRATPSPEQVRAKMLKQFGSHTTAMTRFGHWFHNELKRMALERIGGQNATISEDAREAGHDFISNLMQRSRGG